MSFTKVNGPRGPRRRLRRLDQDGVSSCHFSHGAVLDRDVAGVPAAPPLAAVGKEQSAGGTGLAAIDRHILRSLIPLIGLNVEVVDTDVPELYVGQQGAVYIDQTDPLPSRTVDCEAIDGDVLRRVDDCA